MSVVDPTPGAQVPASTQSAEAEITQIADRLWPTVSRAFAGQRLDFLSKSAIAARIGMIVAEHPDGSGQPLGMQNRRKVIDQLVSRLETSDPSTVAAAP